MNGIEWGKGASLVWWRQLGEQDAATGPFQARHRGSSDEAFEL